MIPHAESPRRGRRQGRSRLGEAADKDGVASARPQTRTESPRRGGRARRWKCLALSARLVLDAVAGCRPCVEPVVSYRAPACLTSPIGALGNAPEGVLDLSEGRLDLLEERL